jgi:hypothetical protein
MVVSSFNQFAIAQGYYKIQTFPTYLLVKIIYPVTTFAGCYIKIDIFYQLKDDIIKIKFHSLTILRLPHNPIFSPLMITMPFIPGIALPLSMVFCMSPAFVTLLARAVAAASAREHDLDNTLTASALPKLFECPRVPEEVHIP